jgi:hemerythrin-like metal-binding protein
MLHSWDASCSTGISAIDVQHRRLLGLVDALDRAEQASAGAAVIGILLDHVMDCAVSHFLTEEALMARVDYPRRDQDEMIEQHRTVLPLLSFRREWLTDDEFGLDRKLAAFVDGRSPARPLGPATDREATLRRPGRLHDHRSSVGSAHVRRLPAMA